MLEIQTWSFFTLTHLYGYIFLTFFVPSRRSFFKVLAKCSAYLSCLLRIGISYHKTIDYITTTFEFIHGYWQNSKISNKEEELLRQLARFLFTTLCEMYLIQLVKYYISRVCLIELWLCTLKMLQCCFLG